MQLDKDRQLEDANERISKLKTQLKDTQQSKLKIMRELVFFKKTIERSPIKSETEMKALKMKLAASEAKNENYLKYSQEMSQLRREVKKLQSEITASSQKGLSVLSSSDCLQKEIQELKKEKAILQQKLTEQIAASEEAFDKAEELQKEVVELRNNCHKYNDDDDDEENTKKQKEIIGKINELREKNDEVRKNSISKGIGKTKEYQELKKHAECLLEECNVHPSENLLDCINQSLDSLIKIIDDQNESDNYSISSDDGDTRNQQSHTHEVDNKETEKEQEEESEFEYGNAEEEEGDGEYEEEATELVNKTDTFDTQTHKAFQNHDYIPLIQDDSEEDKREKREHTSSSSNDNSLKIGEEEDFYEEEEGEFKGSKWHDLLNEEECNEYEYSESEYEYEENANKAKGKNPNQNQNKYSSCIINNNEEEEEEEEEEIRKHKFQGTPWAQKQYSDEEEEEIIVREVKEEIVYCSPR